jgi:hypothetical protein
MQGIAASDGKAKIEVSDSWNSVYRLRRRVARLAVLRLRGLPMVRTGVIVTPPPFNRFTRTCLTPRIFAGFIFLRYRVSAAEMRFDADFFCFAI